ncbi:inorganic diphosphatase [Cryomorphaceae bacterium 1068]|nr:inorganic diphosphatase [Cryomorphaceae bacterium 1068]
MRRKNVHFNVEPFGHKMKAINHRYILLFSYSLFFLLLSCGNTESDEIEKADKASSKDEKGNTNFLEDYEAIGANGTVNAIIEIPSGTVEKWELNKTNGQIEPEHVNNALRIINYLGYPGNYGMVPKTILSKELGGDGDPLDIIVLGPPVDRGGIIECKVIGILYLMDNQEQDDKLVAVSPNSMLYEVDDVSELEAKYNGISEILEIWFTNYKGPGKITSNGFGNKISALEVLAAAIKQYELSDAATIPK